MSLHRRTRDALRAHRPRRRLGQSFLVDARVAARIVAAAAPDGREVVEIGAGLGALSDLLGERARRLILVEVDPALADDLRTRFASRTNVSVIEADALSVDFDALIGGDARALVVANLPYSVGSQILLRLLEERRRFDRLVLMLQREVVERLTASPGTKAYGALSVWTALAGEARLLFRVPAGAFRPRPKVESAVVDVRLAREPRVALDDEHRLRAVVRAAFGQRRKTLRNALAPLASPDDLAGAGIDPSRRGETLTLEEFARLANALGTRRAAHA